MQTMGVHYLEVYSMLRPNTKISVFRVTGLKILSRVGTHIFVYFIFLENKYNFMHFERHFAFQMHKIILIFQKT